MKKHLLFFLMMLLLTAVKSQHVEKVTSINYYGYNGLNPSNITVFNNKLYFFGTNDPQYVDKLMLSDGSEAGVSVVKQIDSVKQYPSLRHLTVLNNLLIFDNYIKLWKSDGTTAGTSAIANIATSSTKYVVLNNKVYFGGDASNSNPLIDQLWQTDGTISGTKLTKTINPTGAAKITNMFTAGGKIYFSASDGVQQGQLWISDGTTAGTTLLKIINPTGMAYPSEFVLFKDKVYFNADDGVNGYQIWVTDGTPTGTMKITNINSSGGIGFNPTGFTLFDSKLFFMGYDVGNFVQLWSTDGTNSGTIRVKTEHTLRNGVRGFYPHSMAIHKNALYIAGYDSLTKVDQLWKSDGTMAGTVRITDSPKGLFPDRLFSFQNKLIMTGYDTISNQVQLFYSDGTKSGTKCPTPTDTWGQYPFYPWETWVPFNNALYYKGAYAYFADYQLCRFTDTEVGIEEKSVEISSIYPNPTNGMLNVILPLLTGTTSIGIYNSQGILVYKSTSAKTSNIIDLSNLPKGFYLLKVMSNNQNIVTKKIIKK
jgi:ELWxxDGT repeat protein